MGGGSSLESLPQRATEPQRKGAARFLGDVECGARSKHERQTSLAVPTVFKYGTVYLLLRGCLWLLHQESLNRAWKCALAHVNAGRVDADASAIRYRRSR